MRQQVAVVVRVRIDESRCGDQARRVDDGDAGRDIEIAYLADALPGYGNVGAVAGLAAAVDERGVPQDEISLHANPIQRSIEFLDTGVVDDLLPLGGFTVDKAPELGRRAAADRKSTRLNSSH